MLTGFVAVAPLQDVFKSRSWFTEARNRSLTEGNISVGGVSLNPSMGREGL